MMTAWDRAVNLRFRVRALERIIDRAVQAMINEDPEALEAAKRDFLNRLPGLKGQVKRLTLK